MSLAVVALGGGVSKTFLPREKLATAPGGEWTTHFSGGFIRTLGVIEILAAVGLVAPAVLDIAPTLVPVTAACWMALMVGAMITHFRDGQLKFVAINVVYFALAAFVAWGRFWPESSTA
ncbi:DoxX family protein [Nocardia asteroides]|uniref:DoxX family protein n=1 Tax=Nocardia asteroides TaxID=1824 RepID=UPI0037C90E49